jgi:hypothetical protein
LRDRRHKRWSDRYDLFLWPCRPLWTGCQARLCRYRSPGAYGAQCGRD